MADKLKAILEEMGCEGVEVNDWRISFKHNGKTMEITPWIEYGTVPAIDIDITEDGG